MITFTVWGFIQEGEKLFDFNLSVFADSPVDAIEKTMKKHANLVVSSVCRSIPRMNAPC
jgi:hypothetical protein